MTPHPLDRNIMIDGQVVTLRFSMGALAKINRELGANTPIELAEKLRLNDPVLKAENMQVLFKSMCLGVAPNIVETSLFCILPVMAEMIEEGFS